MAVTNPTVEALLRKIGGEKPEAQVAEQTVQKPKGYEHVHDETLYTPDDFNFLEAQRLTTLLDMKQKLEKPNPKGEIPHYATMGEIGKKATDALQTVNKQINQIVKHFSSSDNNAAFLRKFAEHMPQITQLFGNKNEQLYSLGSHLGTDFGTQRGEAVSLPPGNWKVVDAYQGAGDGGLDDWTNKGYGNSVLAVNQNTGEKIRLSHLQDVAVKPGDIVHGGVIGSAGTSGHSTGVHTDVEYYDPSGKLGDVTNTHYVSNLFAEPKKVVQTPDKRMAEVQKKVTAFQNVLAPQVKAAQNTMKPLQTYGPPKPVVQPPTPMVQPQKPMNNPWATPVVYNQPKPAVNPPQQQVQKPIVRPPVTQPTKTPNLLQNAINAFSNLFKPRK